MMAPSYGGFSAIVNQPTGVSAVVKTRMKPNPSIATCPSFASSQVTLHELGESSSFLLYAMPTVPYAWGMPWTSCPGSNTGFFSGSRTFDS